MQFSISYIGKEYCKLEVDGIKTGVMDREEALRVAVSLLDAASELMASYGIDYEEVDKAACDVAEAALGCL